MRRLLDRVFKPRRPKDHIFAVLKTILERINQMFQEVADARAAMDMLKAASDRAEARMDELKAKIDELLAQSPTLSDEDKAALAEIKALAEGEGSDLNAAADRDIVPAAPAA